MIFLPLTSRIFATQTSIDKTLRLRNSQCTMKMHRSLKKRLTSRIHRTSDCFGVELCEYQYLNFKRFVILHWTHQIRKTLIFLTLGSFSGTFWTSNISSKISTGDWVQFLLKVKTFEPTKFQKDTKKRRKLSKPKFQVFLPSFVILQFFPPWNQQTFLLKTVLHCCLFRPKSIEEY